MLREERECRGEVVESSSESVDIDKERKKQLGIARERFNLTKKRT